MSRLLHAAHAQLARTIFASRHSPFRQVRLFGCLQAKGQSPQASPSSRAHQKSGPFLRRRYPASSVIRPCPTPADIAIQDSVEAEAASASTGRASSPAAATTRASTGASPRRRSASQSISNRPTPAPT